MDARIPASLTGRGSQGAMAEGAADGELPMKAKEMHFTAKCDPDIVSSPELEEVPCL